MNINEYIVLVRFKNHDQEWTSYNNRDTACSIARGIKKEPNTEYVSVLKISTSIDFR